MRIVRLLALAFLLASVAPSSASAQPDGTGFPRSFFGMTATRATDYPKVTFGTLGHPGVGVWALIERAQGVYDFSFTDNFVEAAVQHGLLDAATNTVNVAITLGYTPKWYAANPDSCKDIAGGISQCTSGPTNVQGWTNYIAALMAHYDGVRMPHIRHYELWNEANAKVFWTGSIADMLQLAKAAYPLIHADPHSMLLTPSVVGPTTDAAPMPPFITASRVAWMTEYLEAGGARYADGGAFHGYIAGEGIKPYPMPEADSTPACERARIATCYGSIVTEATAMRQVFDQHGLAGKPMFDTEGSWGKGSITDPDLQVAWLARWYLLQAGLRDTTNLQMVAWFAWDKTNFDWGSIEDDSGQPTAAGIAFNQVQAWLVGATLDQPCSSDMAGTWTCSLRRPDGYRALAVWNTQGTASYTPDIQAADYRDLAGSVVNTASGTPIPIGNKPVLIETANPGVS